jgi:hypothetical protein
VRFSPHLYRQWCDKRDAWIKANPKPIPLPDFDILSHLDKFPDLQKIITDDTNARFEDAKAKIKLFSRRNL